MHVALPIEPNARGHAKEIQWKLKAFHIPVVRFPAGDAAGAAKCTAGEGGGFHTLTKHFPEQLVVKSVSPLN